MAALFADSFDHYAIGNILGKWTTSPAEGSGGTASIPASGRRSTNCLEVTGTGFVTNTSNSYAMTLTPSGTTCIVGLAFRAAVLAFANLSVSTTETSSNRIMAIQDAGASQVWLRINADSTLSVLQGTTILGTTTATLTFDSYNYIELKVVIHNSAGTVDLYIDGVSALSLTGQDTQATGNTSWNGVRIGPGRAGGSQTVTWRFDDLYILDGSGSDNNAVKGDTRIDAIYGNGAGTKAEFTPSAGSNYQNVDETAPDSDTTYNETAVVNEIDTFAFPDAPAASATQHFVQVCTFAKKTDSGSSTLAGVTRIGSTDYVGSAVAQGSGYTYARTIWGVKPSDSTAWVDTDINAAEFGYKKVS